MAKFSDIMLVADYDRTLTAPDSTIPQVNKDAIRRFMEQGGTFTVNTGRSVPMFYRQMEEIPTNMPFLLYNGSAAYDTTTRSLMDPEEIRVPMWEILDAVNEKFPEFILEVQGVDAHYSYGNQPQWRTFFENQGCPCRELRQGQVISPFLKFAMMGEPRGETVSSLFHAEPWELRRMDEAERWIREHYPVSVFRAAPRIIDVHAPKVSKLRIARHFQKKYGIRYLVCIGDAENDRMMLEGADFAFCPGDALLKNDFPNLCPCAQGAVADLIDRVLPTL